MKIGYVNKGYAYERCIVNKILNAKYKYINRKKEPLYFFNKVMYRLGFISSTGNTDSYFHALKEGNLTLLHTFNTVCKTRQLPWCCTFESTLPRTDFTAKREWATDKKVKLDKHNKKLIRLMQHDNAFAFIALSESAYKIQKNMLRMLRIPEVEAKLIMSKTIVVHPPQEGKIDLQQIQKKFDNFDTLEFIIIGRDFFRKGGAQVIDVLSEYYKGGYRFNLTVVSSLNYNDPASKVLEEEMIHYKSIIKSSSWIKWYERLPNKDVIELCKKAHVGLLPSFADTYGYSVLEMQACGCPVVTTDIRALPEINNDGCGWICHLPKNSLDEVLFQTDEQRKEIKGILKKELDRVFREIFTCVENGESEIIFKKGIESLNRIKNEHDPIEYGLKLENIYKQGILT